jgi:hypothetical protein
VAAGRGVRPVGVVVKAPGELIAAPPGPVARASGAGLPIVAGPLGEVSRSSNAGTPTVPVIDPASSSTVRVADASVCASPLIVGASAFVRGVKAVVVGVTGLVAGAIVRPSGGALFVAERNVGATALVAPTVAARAAGCVSGVAACVTAGSFEPGVPVVADVGALGFTGAAALVTRAEAFVTGVAARTARLVLATDAASSSGVDVPGAATVAFGASALGAVVPLTGVVAWLTGSATCWTVDVAGCVACPTVPPNESAIAGDVPTAMLVRVASVTPTRRDRRMRSA